MALRPVDGFDWTKLTWGRPDSPPSKLCSYCSASIPEDDAPLIMWRDNGGCVRFCETCQEDFWQMRGDR